MPFFGTESSLQNILFNSKNIHHIESGLLPTLKILVYITLLGTKTEWFQFCELIEINEIEKNSNVIQRYTHIDILWFILEELESRISSNT